MHSFVFVRPPLLTSQRGRSACLSRRPAKCAAEPVPVTKRKLLRLFPAPSETVALLRRPEAVVAATAAGLFLLAASAFRSVRAAFASVAAQTYILADSQRRVALLEKRERERLFLQSAVSATEATLENTKMFLAAQRGRADAAESRLEEIAASRQQLDDAAREIRERRKELAEKEMELEEERRRTGIDGKACVDMEVNLERTREGVEALEKVAENERNRLEDEEREQRDMLENARRETARLEALLREKKEQLEREKEERDRYAGKHAEAERLLKVASGSLERTVTDLEERRKRIEEMEAEAERVQIEAKRKKEGMMAVVEGEADSDELDSSMQTLKRYQDICEEAMKRGNDKYESKMNEIKQMKSLIDKRDAELEALHIKLEAVNSVSPTSSTEDTEKGLKKSSTDESQVDMVSPEGENNVFSTRQGKVAKPVEAQCLDDSVDIDTEAEVRVLNASGVLLIPPDMDANSTDAAASAMREGNLHGRGQESADMTISETTEGNSRATSVTSQKREVSPKRRRGRPRKNDVSTVSEATPAKPVSDAAPAKPKRGRGRPRKSVPNATASDQPVTKRKRGRPRKTAVTAVSQTESSEIDST